MSATESNYYLPEPSKWPVIAVTGIFTLLLGVILWANGVNAGNIIIPVGFALILFLFYGWFRDVINENLSGKYNEGVSTSFRQGMFWFITSEVFFFASFFGSLFYLRSITLPYLGGEGHLATSHLLWENFTHTWPLLNLPDASNYTPAKEAMGAMGLPLWNTIILLTSGATITWAHWGLKKDNNTQLVIGLCLTVALGALFLALQAYEYGHAYTEMDLTLNSGIYGSTFYLLTGFHGMHVTLGTIMLIVITVRSMKHHFTEENHFAFEGVAWYWHFVDVVWLGLYVFVYWL
jgi:cytochrome c oxidase subunit 3